MAVTVKRPGGTKAPMPQPALQLHNADNVY